MDIEECHCYSNGLVYDPLEIIHRHGEMCSCTMGIMQCSGNIKTNDCRDDQMYYPCTFPTDIGAEIGMTKIA